MVASRIIIGSVLLLLTACTVPRDAYEYAHWRTKPTVSVSSTQASVEKFIEISTAANIGLHAESSLAQRTVEVHLGACVIPTDELASQIWCGGSSPYDLTNIFRLPEGVELAEEDTAYKTVELRLTRGEEVTLRHSFRLRATSPSSVTLVGVSIGEPSEHMPGGMGSTHPQDQVTLTFH